MSVYMYDQVYANERAGNFEWLNNYLFLYLTARIYFRKHSCFLTRELPARGVPIAYVDLTYLNICFNMGGHSNETLRALQEIGYCTIIYVPHRLRTNFVFLPLKIK